MLKRLAIFLFFLVVFPTAVFAEVTVVGEDALVQKAGAILSDELSSRSLHLDVIIGLECDLNMAELDSLNPITAEGFKILKQLSGDVVIAGADPRGVLFGVGKLLRMDEIRTVSSSPENRYRVQNFNENPRYKDQLDPRNLATFDSRVRDLALFGANGIQIWRKAPKEIIEIIRSYGLDVWIVDYVNANPSKIGSAEGFRQEIDFRRRMLDNYSRVDHFVMKSGDPGDLTIDEFFRFANAEASIVKEKHPEARIWVIPQHYVDAPADYFDKAIEYCNNSQWVDGVMAGCWTRFPASEVRAKVIPGKSVMMAPDITHIYSNMCPARNMDYVLAKSLGRICISISPDTQKHIHNWADSFVEGNMCYSEGTTDDLHKCLWTAFDWDPEVEAEDVVKEYARLFIPEVDADRFAKGVMAIEHNAIGPLENSDGMLSNLAFWQDLMGSSPKRTMDNIRFLMPLLRAHYDAYIYKRWMRDLPIEKQCYALLANVQDKPGKVMTEVERLLSKCETPVDNTLKTTCLELYQSIYEDSEKWTIENQKNSLISQMDEPLIDSRYIQYQFEIVRQCESNKEVILELRKLGNRFNSHGDVTYFNLGDFSTEYITGIDSGWADDPVYLNHPVRMFGCKANRFTYNGLAFNGKPAPRAWLVQAGKYYDGSMTLTFPGLEKNSNYKVRVTYTGEVAKSPVNIKMYMNGKLVHRPLLVNTDVEGEFTLPFPSSQDGTISLTWKSNYGERGVAIAEISFIKQQ